MTSPLLRAARRTTRWRLAIVAVAVAAVAAMMLLTPRGDTATAALEDGEHFGFVSEADASTLVLDPAVFLTGDEAVEAAVEDGELTAGEELPNGFYVRDVSPGPTELPLGDGFAAALLDNRTITHRPPLNAAELAAIYAGDADSSWLYDSLEHLPVVMTIEDGEVVRAVQHYLP